MTPTQFLEAVAPGGPWLITAIAPGGYPCSTLAKTANEVDSLVMIQAGADFYWTPAALHQLPAKGKPTKGDVAGSWWQWVDLDPPKGADLDTWRTDALARLQAAAPTIIIDSGRGYWGLWQRATFSTDHAEIEGVNKALADALGADHCWNIDRLARLPGTVNSKTGRVASVIAWTPGPATLPAPIATPAPTPAEWTDGPVPEFTGTSWTDDEVINRAVNAHTTARAFGGKATFAGLWNAEADALAFYPSRSEADAALAAHLAFWTGKDCARIERLMWRSPLRRDRWDERYLRITITKEVARCREVYNVPDLSARAGLQLLTVEQQADYFAGCCYVIGQHRVLMPNGDLLKPEQFKATKGGYEFQIDPNGGRSSKNAFEVFTESRCTKFPKADAICFRPDLAPGAIVEKEGRRLVNAYAPVTIELGDGDPSRFLDLLQRMLPDENDRAIVLAYLAALRQFPGRKFRWAPLLQGVEGNGKSAIGKVAEYCVGERYAHRVNAKELGDSGSKFTGWLDRKLLVVIEEVHVSDRRNLIDALKPLITDDRVEIQRKGVDQFTADNRANFILTSNHKDAITKTANDRRYAVFFTAQQSVEDKARDGLNDAYFVAFYRWLNDAYFVAFYRWLDDGGYADVAGWLTRYQIPDALNPATSCVTAPRTSSTDAAITESLGQVEQEILEACEEGGRQGFRGGWISSVALADLLKELRRTIGPRKRGQLLKSIGYIPHPALTDGRASQSIYAEGMKRPTLYVKEGSIMALNITDGGAATDAYLKAQGYPKMPDGKTGT